MAAQFNQNIDVKLDGRLVNFKSVTMTKPKFESNQMIPVISIELTLWDGRTISDNGSRIEIIINPRKS